MRVVTSISLLLLLLLNLFGFYVSFVVNQSSVRNEMAEVIKQSEQHSTPCINLSQQDFKNIVWAREGKEFRFNGKLYDVASIQFGNGAVKIFVEEDTAESELVEGFVTMFSSSKQKDPNNSPLQLLLNHFLKEFTATTVAVLYYPVVSITSFFEKEIHFSSFIANRQSPPPNLHLA